MILAKGMRGCSSLWQGRHGDRSRYQGLEITGYIATAVREMKARPEEGPTYNSQSLLPETPSKGTTIWGTSVQTCWFIGAFPQLNYNEKH